MREPGFGALRAPSELGVAASGDRSVVLEGDGMLDMSPASWSSVVAGAGLASIPTIRCGVSSRSFHPSSPPAAPPRLPRPRPCPSPCSTGPPLVLASGCWLP